MKNLFSTLLLMLLFVVTPAFSKTPMALPKDQIRKALQTPFDLLAQMPIVYHLKEKAPNRFKEEASFQVTDFNLRCLVVESRNAKSTSTTLQGTRSDNEGYIILNYDYLQQAGLITPEGNFRGNSSTDTFTYQGKTYTILDIEPVGQLVDTFVAFKIYFKT